MYRNHGYVPSDEDLAAVVVGKTTQPELEELLGRPGSQGVLTGSDWYYVGSRWEYFGAAPPREIDRRVVAVSFDPSGVVSNVSRFGLDRGRVVVLSQRVTDPGMSGQSVLRRIFSNVGNFNAGQILNKQ